MVENSKGIEVLYTGSIEEKSRNCEKVCKYLLLKYCEGYDGYESIDLFKGIDGGTSGKGLFIKCSKG